MQLRIMVAASPHGMAVILRHLAPGWSLGSTAPGLAQEAPDEEQLKM